MTDRIKLALIYGSTREGRFCDVVASWAGEQIWRRRSFLLDIVDPLQLNLPARQDAALTADLRNLRSRLSSADAFLVVTPEYNRSYPASLKHLVDATGAAWQAKPVGFVSYGNASGGVRAVEQLRQVATALHAVSVRDAVSIVDARSRFGPDGVLRDRDRDREEDSMASMLAQLNWWARILRDARRSRPYEQQVA